jgi:hypothetical protein
MSDPRIAVLQALVREARVRPVRDPELPGYLARLDRAASAAANVVPPAETKHPNPDVDTPTETDGPAVVEGRDIPTDELGF